MKNAENLKMTKINDVYFISKFLKNFNPNFCLVYLFELNKYAVFDTAKKQIVITYDRYPDYGILVKLKVTSRENIQKYLSQIEQKNLEIELKDVNKKIGEAKDQLCEVFSYAEKAGGGNLGQNQIKKIINEE